MRNVAPTKSNMISLKNELKFAKLGHELLDQKRNILVLELLNLVEQAVDHEEKVERALAEAYRTLEYAVLDMGKLKLYQVASAINIESNLKISQRKIMGVPLPVVDTTFEDYPPYYSLMGTSFWTDNSLGEFKAVVKVMGKLAELKISIMRLAKEVKKTIKKVNALEKIAIPDLQETVKYIENRLEENERDMVILLKMTKQRLEKKRLEISNLN
ncbi:MAG: V-type ATP synthase subunit D [Spirochaetaceae bacterium]|nr:V-type ATP synthase subunit D [Spirochaetaceae bacterium]